MSPDRDLFAEAEATAATAQSLTDLEWVGVAAELKDLYAHGCDYIVYPKAGKLADGRLVIANPLPSDPTGPKFAYSNTSADTFLATAETLELLLANTNVAADLKNVR